MIESPVYPHHSDVDWQEYVDWVSLGFGDEWFQEEEGDVTPPPPSINGRIQIVTNI